jgi:hypothetical protein
MLVHYTTQCLDRKTHIKLMKVTGAGLLLLAGGNNFAVARILQPAPFKKRRMASAWLRVITG